MDAPTVTRYTPFDELPEWMSIEEVRTWIDAGRSATYEAARSGKWRILKAGRLTRVHKSTFAPTATDQPAVVVPARRRA